MIAEVIVDVTNSQVDKIFDYKIENEEIKAGQRVLVPFGNRHIQGFVINIKESSSVPESKLKSVSVCIDDFACINNEMLKLMQFMIKKYHLRYIDAIRLFIPAEMRTDKVKPLSKYIAYVNNFDYELIKKSIRANAKNQLALLEYIQPNNTYEKSVLCSKFSAICVNKFIEMGIITLKQQDYKRTPNFNIIHENVKKHTAYQKNAIEKILQDNKKTYLLYGVTGSGKTEVYMSVIEQVINSGKNAIMLVPEISLTPQVLSNFKSRFDNQVAILHSGLSAGERFDEWRRIMFNEAKIVIGARSAIFAPIDNVGVIIIDEEHESSYISENNPRYNTFDIANFRKEYNECPLVLASATPCLEHFNKAKNGEFELLELPQRINGKEMPKIQIVDMISELRMGNSGIFSRALISQLDKCIKNKKQAMIFINRRGFSSFMRCSNCGYVPKCSDCDVSLVYHKDEEKLKCHYCGKRYRALTKCPECGSESIRHGAVGTQKIVTELQKMYPNVKIVRMDNDTTRTKNAHQKLLDEFSSCTPSILVGTQMIAKGHDFKNVTLVGIIDGDQSLYQTDYKSTEKTFSLITQMSGRAGRDDYEGFVILQTYAPKHYCYRFIANYDYNAFFNKELNIRKVTQFPPFSVIIRLLFSASDEQLLCKLVRMCYNEITELQKSCEGDFFYLDVMKSPIGRIKNKYREQILARLNPQNADIIIEKMYSICDKYTNPKVSIFVEIDPQSLS